MDMSRELMVMVKVPCQACGGSGQECEHCANGMQLMSVSPAVVLVAACDALISQDEKGERLGRCLRAARTAAGKGIGEVEELFGVPSGFLGAVERGDVAEAERLRLASAAIQELKDTEG